MIRNIVLETYLNNRLEKKDILLMTHIVMGYPSFEDNYGMIAAMVEAGVDLMELQIPFSEPIADGPTILKANHRALAKGATVEGCLDFAKRMARSFPIPFLLMTYYNILFKHGVERFVRSMADGRLAGAIVPDLPPEEGSDYLKVMNKWNLAPVWIFSPTTPADRMRHLDALGRGFVYCVARKGVTGDKTAFGTELTEYLERCRRACSLPIAVGFGVQQKADIDFLKGKADVAVIGTQIMKLMEEEGIEPVKKFIRGLR